MKTPITLFLALTSLLVIPASHTMHQNPTAQRHIGKFSEALYGIMEAKTTVETAHLVQSLLQSKKPAEIKRMFDTLSTAYIQDTVGNPRIKTLDIVAKEDELRNIFDTYSTEQQAKFVAHTLRELDNQKKAIQHTREHERDLKKLSDSMALEKAELKKLWLNYDKSHTTKEDLQEQTALAKSRAEELKNLTQTYDKRMHDLTGKHVLRLLPTRRIQPIDLTPAVEDVD
ncbi:hypothetical protein JST99_04815 [Candidatus Dependentiae bacterium]|nr:hypothetical protein [Candidatus Dependentiae bacterium]